LRDFDASQYEKLPRALSARGISAGAIRQIMGENWLRILEAARTPAVKAGSDK
jgi:microsomal dipeptidase-like Zn-dependent dipeptidase